MNKIKYYFYTKYEQNSNKMTLKKNHFEYNKFF